MSRVTSRMASLLPPWASSSPASLSGAPLSLPSVTPMALCPSRSTMTEM